MKIEQEIVQTIQQIGAIFMKKNIKAAPICVELLQYNLQTDTDNLIVQELLIYLSDLFKDYQRSERKMHKYIRYLAHFHNILRENSDGHIIIGQRRTV